MITREFSDQFDVLYNNITSNQAAGLNEYEKSVFLTKAEKEIVKNYFSAGSAGNNLHQGFDDSAKRQADFSTLMKTKNCQPGTVSSVMLHCVETGTSDAWDYPASAIVLRSASDSSVVYSWDNIPENTPYEVSWDSVDRAYTITIPSIDDTIILENAPFQTGTITKTITGGNVENRIDSRSTVYTFPDDVFIVINETYVKGDMIRQINPLRYDEYTRLMLKPYKRPVKNEVWRLINTGSVSGSVSSKYVEIITNMGEENGTYTIRYIRLPKPIILAPLDGLSIDGISTTTECELDPILHEEILQRAVELAKGAWTNNGQDNVQLAIEAGKRSE